MSDNEVEQYESDRDEINPVAHKRLLAGVTRLQKSQFIKKAIRNEPSLKRGEFNLIKPSTGDDDHDADRSHAAKKQSKVNVSDLVNVLDKSNKHLQLGKLVKKTGDKKKVLPVPLEKPAADKLQRAINYEKAKEKLERWDAIVTKNRSADHLSFPLNQDDSQIQIRDNVQVPSKFRIKSDMMLQMEKIEPQIFEIGKPNDDVNDDASEPKLTREELIQRSRELRQLRMKESARSAKAHHQNKIKSKKYHRILKKEKMKQQIQEFEMLQKTDPEAALRKIEQLDRSRIEERAQLRHRNTGTWAKNLQVRAKYDKDARRELSEQIAISRELTAKKNIDESDDDEDAAGTAQANDGIESDPFNPWMTAGTKTNGTNQTNDVGEFLSGYRKYWQTRNESEKQLNEFKADDSVENQHETQNNGDDPETRKTKTKTIALKSSKTMKKSKLNAGWLEEDISNVETKSKKTKKLAKTSKVKKEAPIVDNIDDLFDEAEDALRDKCQKKYNKIQSELSSRKANGRKHLLKGSDEEDSRIELSFKKQAKRPELDEALNGDEADGENQLSKNITNTLNSMKATAASNPTTNDTDYESTNINPNDIAKVKPQHLSTALPDTVYSVADDGFNEYDDEYHFDEEKKMSIAEAFEDDDIVAEFKREKDDEAKKNGPQEIDMSMPGWGSWGGSGINPTKQKTKRKLILRFPTPEKRRVDNQGNLVIIENRDQQLQKHLVANLPFPFTSVDDYEKSIRVPIGKEFVPATAHRVLTKPAVITKSGTIIEPMNEQMLVNKIKKRPTKTDRRIAQIAS